MVIQFAITELTGFLSLLLELVQYRRQTCKKNFAFFKIQFLVSTDNIYQKTEFSDLGSDVWAPLELSDPELFIGRTGKLESEDFFKILLLTFPFAEKEIIFFSLFHSE